MPETLGDDNIEIKPAIYETGKHKPHDYLDVSVPQPELQQFKELKPYMKRELGVVTINGNMDNVVLMLPHAYGRILKYDPREIIASISDTNIDLDNFDALVETGKAYLELMNVDHENLSHNDIISTAAKEYLLRFEQEVWKIKKEYTSVSEFGKTIVVQEIQERQLPSGEAASIGVPIKASSRKTGGTGDSYTVAFAVDIVNAYTKQIPNIVIASMSNSPYETNMSAALIEQTIVKDTPTLPESVIEIIKTTKFTDSAESLEDARKLLDPSHPDYKKQSIALTTLIMLQNFRYKLGEMASKARDPLLLLNIHTMYNRKGIDMVIGSRHGLSTDFRVELLLGLFLADRGYDISFSSIYPLPGETLDYTESEKQRLQEDKIAEFKGQDKVHKPTANFPGEERSYELYQDWLTSQGFTHNQLREIFRDYPDLTKAGVLRGTNILTALHRSIDRDISMLQLEVNQALYANSNRRIQLARDIQEFITNYEKNRLADLDYLVDKYNGSNN